MRFLAWPRRVYIDTVIQIAVNAGEIGLFTIDDGFNERSGDVLRIRRTMINGACDDKTFIRILADANFRDCSSAAAPNRPQN